MGGISSSVKSRTKKEREEGEVTVQKRVGSLTVWLIECEYEQERMKKRGKHIYRENSEYHADTSRKVFAAALCFTSSLAGYGKGRFVYIFIFFEVNDQ